MEADIVGTLVSAGPLGAIIVALAVAYWRQSVVLKVVQEARVTDAQRVTGTLLELNDKWTQAINNHTNAVNDLRAFLQGRGGG